MSNPKTAVLIDAGYLRLLTKHFGKNKPLKIDITKFAKYLAIKKGLWMDHAYYYTAPPFQQTPPTDDQIARKRGYDKFIAKLSTYPNITIREGRVQKVDGDYHQKGVDTLLVMDLMELANSKKYQTIILLACDTDFVPIINKVQNEDNIKIILYYYSDRIRKSQFSMSNELLQTCDNKELLTKEYFTRNLIESSHPK